jgi:hypothetical protein
MASTPLPSNRFLHLMVNATAGNFKQYMITFWSQFFLGILYSFNYFDSVIAGFVLGFMMPVLWIILIYRMLLLKAKVQPQTNFPDWMQKNPGNTFVILFDIVFLGAVWYFILTGIYNPTWLKVIFTCIFPIITLSMLRSIVIYPASGNVDEKENIFDENNKN